MGSLVRRTPTDLAQPTTSREVEALRHQTGMRALVVQAEAYVAKEKAGEVAALTRDAMTDYAMLSNYADVISGNNMFLRDELRFYTDIARLGAGEIIASTVDKFCREF